MLDCNITKHKSVSIVHSVFNYVPMFLKKTKHPTLCIPIESIKLPLGKSTNFHWEFIVQWGSLSIYMISTVLFTAHNRDYCDC